MDWSCTRGFTFITFLCLLDVFHCIIKKPSNSVLVMNIYEKEVFLKKEKIIGYATAKYRGCEEDEQAKLNVKVAAFHPWFKMPSLASK